MAKTIPQLTDATTVNAADELIIQQGGITKRATGAELAKGLNTINGTVNVKDFGAVGDGVADDTAAINAALATGQTVFVPPTSAFYLISATLSLQSSQGIIGAGRKSLIRSNTLNVNVIAASGVTGAFVDNVAVRPSGLGASYTEDNGIYINNSTDCWVTNCYISNHRSSGVIVHNSSRCRVLNCLFESSPVADGENTTLADIGIVRNSSNNIVRGNVINSGQANGILVQAIESGNACNFNVISGNTVVGAKAYGIIAYRVDDKTNRSVLGTVIVGNTVENTRGSILNSVTSTYTYGAGIYAQGAEDTTVSGNTVRNSHAASLSFAQTLAPGAIGCTNVSSFSITGNTIHTAGMFGVDVGDGNFLGENFGGATITGNVITDATLCAVNVRRRGFVSIANNSIDASTGNSCITVNPSVASFNITGVASTDVITALGHNFVNGQRVMFNALTGGAGLSIAPTLYFVRDVSGDTFKVSTSSGGEPAVNFSTDITAGSISPAYYENICISGNVVRNTDATAAINLNWTDSPVVSGNSVNGSTTHGISVQNSTNPCITGNIVKNHSSRGVQATSTVSGGLVCGNRIIGNGSSGEGIRLDGNAYCSSNRISGCVNATFGSHDELINRRNVTITDTVGAAETDLATFTIPASTLTTNGDCFRFIAHGTTANNANTKTLKFKIGSATVFDKTLTTGQESPWRLVVELTRRVANGQFCVASLSQGGTTSKVEVEYTNPNQTEANSIAVALTGTATANADIRRTAFFSEFIPNSFA
jgi:parallel beta-helix repeat protein